ncbi:HAD hydrolase-like protein [Clostridium sp.]|uniref:HAD family hydrolase n=1 Tax=Clostridium sp. TaxID=1506 RepID=UPI00284C1605|nr:HAD hydrolase-like protein [Clostridium sp.]MDR3596506.1 HAD hydrolase-like protein [Clostridium sp.]
MNQNIIISDFDGVIGNSLKVALIITKKIATLFDSYEKVNSFSDFYRLLGKNSELNNVTETESNTLRELYRILLRHSSSEIGLFIEVLDIYSKLYKKPLIVSSTYTDTIKSILGKSQILFDRIYGYNNGHKEDILQNIQMTHEITYITDTVRDIIICKGIGIPVIATCWGYDSIEKIREEKPDYLAKNYNELKDILIKHNYLPNN